MNKNYLRKDFFKYINTPMSRESIVVLYGANNIKFDKCELYSDFVHSLLQLAFDTYMGDDITSVEEQINHFKWCWNKNIENFKTEGIIFDSPKLYNYYLEFMIETYYSSINKTKIDFKVLIKLWDDIFNYNQTKSNSDIDTLIEIYQIMDSALKTP